MVFQHLGKENGLSQSSVFAIAQDSLGYLWFGTRGGLNKYDGYRMKVYDQVGGFGPAGSDVRTLYVDPVTKVLWAGSLAGLSRYDAAADTFEHFEHIPGDAATLTRGAVKAIHRDAEGRIWVGTSDGLNLYQPGSNDFQRLLPDPSSTFSPGNNISFITSGPDDQVLVGTHRGLYQIHGTGDLAQLTLAPVGNFEQTELTAAAWSQDGTLWLGTQKEGVIAYSSLAGTSRRYGHAPGSATSLSNNSVRTMLCTPAGDLWVGTFAGLNLLPAGSTEFTRYQSGNGAGNGLMDNSIRSLLQDVTGSLWVGTYYGGVHHLDDRYNKFSNFTYNGDPDGLSWKVVSSFAESPNGDLWIGTEGGGLNRRDATTGRFTSYRADPTDPHSISGNNVKQLLLNGDQLWLGTFRTGLNRLDLKTGKFTQFRNQSDRPFSSEHDNVYGLHRSEDLLWILTFGGGLDILDLTTGLYRNFSRMPPTGRTFPLSSNTLRVILPDGEGTYWIGSEEGLNRVTTGADGYPAENEVFLPTEKVYSLHPGEGGHVWVGTYSNGLIDFDPAGGESRTYTRADGLPGNTIFGMLPGPGNSLWISTDNGLSYFDQVKGTFSNYDDSHGLKTLEYNFNAYYKSPTGHLYFGGFNGYTRFDPTEIRPQQFVPNVVLTGLRHGNEEVSVSPTGLLKGDLNDTEKLTFAYGDAAFALHFSTLDYFSPENNRYAYKLEGLDRDWNYSTGQTEAAYTIQREGDYEFLLRGANSDGVWNPVTRRLLITVLPPPWRTWWAYLIYALLAGGLLYALIHFLRMRHKIQLQTIAQRQQEELTEMKLRFFTNITHEFRTPLTLITGPLHSLLQQTHHDDRTRNQLGSIERNARRMLKLVNEILTFRKLATDHQPLTVYRTDLGAFVSIIADAFSESALARQLDLQIIRPTAPINVWLDVDKMEKVVFNLLSNAFKFTPAGGQVHVHIEQRKGSAIIRVVDSGKGIPPEEREEIFKRFYEKPNGRSAAGQGSGIGLALCRQMVELHHGTIIVADRSEGAEFVVRLLLGKDHFEETQVAETADWRTQLTGVTTHTEPVVEMPGAPTEEPAVAESPATTSVEEQIIAPSAKPNESTEEKATLLIVDDNKDIREYISSVFASRYHILLADSGVTGLEATRAKLPDAIISDVMMPDMDGIEFCHAVKTDLDISHIPVILLTARTAEPSRLEGLRTGADDYLTKPFHPEELLLRVRNILNLRRQAREKFARVLTLDPKEVTITNTDEDFLRRALEVVEAEMANYDFKVDNFATQLLVSRSLLFTKLKSLTGQTPNNFVKKVRLKRAAQLLETGQLTVAEVAHAVGFKDVKYFRRCFKQQYEASPSAYVS